MVISLASAHRKSSWLTLVGDGPEPRSIQDRLELVRRAWEAAEFTRGEVNDLHFDLALHDGIEETLQFLDETWRADLVETLKHWALADPDAEPFHIFGGIYAYEREPDPAKAASMRREVEEARAAEVTYFLTVIRPRIDDWWRRRSCAGSTL